MVKDFIFVEWRKKIMLFCLVLDNDGKEINFPSQKKSP